MSALAAYTESVRHLRGMLARLERHGAHAEASQLAAIVRSPSYTAPDYALKFVMRVQTAGYSERMRLLCVACAVPPPPYDHPPSDPNNRFLSQPAALESPPPPAYDESRQRPIQTKACIQTQP